MKPHWTERSIKAYLFKIVADFIDQLENKMQSLPISQDELAKKLGLSKGRVSQILNRRGNVTLKTVILCARTLGLKVSMVAYEDDDPQNKKGLINPEVFRICWERSGKPRDLWAFENMNKQTEVASNLTINVIHANMGTPFYLPLSTGQVSTWNFVEDIPRYYVKKTASTSKEIRDQDHLGILKQ